MSLNSRILIDLKTKCSKKESEMTNLELLAKLKSLRLALCLSANYIEIVEIMQNDWRTQTGAEFWAPKNQDECDEQSFQPQQ